MNIWRCPTSERFPPAEPVAFRGIDVELQIHRKSIDSAQLMNIDLRKSILNRLDSERRALVREDEILEILPRVTRIRATDHSQHGIIWCSLNEENADAAIQGEIEFHRSLGVGFEWKVYGHDKPGDLLSRLERAGFRIGPREAVLVLDLARAGNLLDEIHLRDVVRVDRIAQLADFRLVAEEVFEKNYAFTTTQLADAIQRESVQHRGYVAYLDGEPASIGRLYTHPDSWFGGLYGGCTRRKFRGRGLYRAVVSARARDAAALGAKYLVVDALPTSRPILERLGFEWVTDTWPCEREATK